MARPPRPRVSRARPSSEPRSAVPFEPRVDELPSPTDLDDLLDEQQWHQVRITADCTAARLDLIEVSETRFVGSRLSGLDLDGLRIRDTVFEDCELSGVSMHGSALTRVTFTNCRLSGLVLNASTVRDVRITECKADQLALRMATTERLWCERVLLPAADLYEAQLVLTRFFDCDLTDAELSNVHLDDVHLHGSVLDAVRGVEHLRGATIDSDQMHVVAAALLAAHRIVVTDERA